MARPLHAALFRVSDLRFFFTGCAYDDKFYKEGETVLTKEPCLNCTCRKGALRCHLQVCPYMHDLYPPPSGCVLVERKSACCPKLHCRKLIYAEHNEIVLAYW